MIIFGVLNIVEGIMVELLSKREITYVNEERKISKVFDWELNGSIMQRSDHKVF